MRAKRSQSIRETPEWLQNWTSQSARTRMIDWIFTHPTFLLLKQQARPSVLGAAGWRRRGLDVFPGLCPNELSIRVQENVPHPLVGTSDVQEIWGIEVLEDLLCITEPTQRHDAR